MGHCNGLWGNRGLRESDTGKMPKIRRLECQRFERAPSWQLPTDTGPLSSTDRSTCWTVSCAVSVMTEWLANRCCLKESATRSLTTQQRQPIFLSWFNFHQGKWCWFQDNWLASVIKQEHLWIFLCQKVTTITQTWIFQPVNSFWSPADMWC